MAKLKTQTLVFDGAERNELTIKFDVNVNKDGTFSTTLPPDIVQLLAEANIDMQQNKLGNKGYFSAYSYDELIKKVRFTINEYMSREMTSEKIVIQYCIQTRCSYSFDKDGEVIPNPGSEWSGVEDSYNEVSGGNKRFANWMEGNFSINATSNSAFGFLVYAQPMVRRDYEYKSGKTKTEYQSMSRGGEIAETALENGYYLRWLNDVPCIDVPGGGKVKEMDYSESVCEFFVGMIKSIAIMNEKIKDFLEPDAIKNIADQKLKFLA